MYSLLLMSLITSASVWTNDTTDDIPKKRIPSLRKTMKKIPETSERPDEYPKERIYMEHQSNSIEDVQATQETRNNRVEQLINEMAVTGDENDGNKLANFQPLSHPTIQKKTDPTEDPVVKGKGQDDPLQSHDNLLQIPPPTIRHQSGGSNYTANDPNLGNSNTPYTTSPYGNYQNVYRHPVPVTKHASQRPLTVSDYYGQMGLGKGALDDKLMEKINYMIHLLEQQHNEKTSNVTEEFILYCFLGVFIIFVVDAFARAGKYTR